MSNIYETYAARSVVFYFKTEWEVYAIRAIVIYTTNRVRIRRRIGDSIR